MRAFGKSTSLALTAILLLAACACQPEAPPPSAPASMNGNSERNSRTEPTLSAEKRRQLREEGNPDYPWISAEELKARIDRKQKTILLDIGSGIAPTKVVGAMDILEVDIENWAAKIPKSSAIVTYCGCPQDAAAVRSALKLQKLGFTDVHVLKGGFEAWESAGFPIEPSSKGR